MRQFLRQPGTKATKSLHSMKVIVHTLLLDYSKFWTNYSTALSLSDCIESTEAVFFIFVDIDKSILYVAFLLYWHIS